MAKSVCLSVLMFLFSAAGLCGMPEVKCSLGAARAKTDDGKLVVSTGLVQREYKWTGSGLVTVGLKDIEADREWARETKELADWRFEGLSPDAKGELQGIEAQVSDDEGFTSKHIKVVSTVKYLEAGVVLQHVVWVYPGAPGFRTQLHAKTIKDKSLGGSGKPDEAVDQGDYLPVDLDTQALRLIGYYSDTQHRNTRETPILKEETLEPGQKPGSARWASILAASSEAAGLMLVKESHKCVNTYGAHTGGFSWDAAGLRVDGLGWHSGSFSHDRYRACWASWLVFWHGDDDDMMLALKRFDRARYPVDPNRDIYIMANTWGSGGGPGSSRAAAREEQVLKEIKSAADMGIDIQQIDDGWQDRQWLPGKSAYPTGWGNVRKAAQDEGIKLGLWGAWRIPLDKLKTNYEKGNFLSYKLDFMRLSNMGQAESMMAKTREFILHTGHKVRINWDTTEQPPRVGYFFAREYGNIYLANRKPRNPPNAVYIPWLVLRDTWHLSKYLNLNKFQITVQNVDRTDRTISDAHKHPHDYCLAQTLMGCPIFFQQTTLLSDEAKGMLKPLLNLYKKHRNAMYEGYVFPIGDVPDNAGISGFQNHNPDKGNGYLTIFRQLESKNDKAEIALKFLARKKIQIADLVSGETRKVDVPEDGKVEFSLPKAPGFLYLKYE